MYPRRQEHKNEKRKSRLEVSACKTSHTEALSTKDQSHMIHFTPLKTVAKQALINRMTTTSAQTPHMTAMINHSSSTKPTFLAHLSRLFRVRINRSIWSLTCLTANV